MWWYANVSVFKTHFQILSISDEKRKEKKKKKEMIKEKFLTFMRGKSVSFQIRL